MNIYEQLISNQNIYLAIYSVETYILDKELLSNDDKKLLNELNDKFNEEKILKIINEVKIRLKKLIKDREAFISAMVYFKPKKMEDGEIKFRPVHTAKLIDQIAIVSMLNLLIYEIQYDKNQNPKLILSNISRLIPSNFYGNRISVKPEELFKSWKIQYKKYSQKANNYFKNYHNTGEYKYEVDLDLKNFFPSINPEILYNYILNKLPVNFPEGDRRIFKIIVVKLLIFKIENLDDRTRKIYYGKDYKAKKDYFVKGIAQGLPQGYFWGNICMIEISKIFNDEFPGKSLFYVDDSVIFTNEVKEKEFNNSLEEINKKIKKFTKEYTEFVSGDFFKICNEEIEKFIINLDFEIKVHDNNSKSTFTRIKSASIGEIYLKFLSREVSQVGFEMFSSYSDEEDNVIATRISALVNAIEKEKKLVKDEEYVVKDNIKKQELKSYYDKLIRYYKYLKYRKIRLNLREDTKLNEKIFNQYLKENLQQESEENLDKFMEKYKEDIWGPILTILSKNETNKNNLKDYLLSVNKMVFGFENEKSSYIYKMYDWIIIDNINEYIFVNYKYNSLEYLARIKLRKYTQNHSNIIENYIKKIIENESSQEIATNLNMFSDRFFKTIKLVDENTNELKRMFFNAIYSQLFSVKLGDCFVLTKWIKKPLTYGELRKLICIRNKNFSLNLLNSIDLSDEKNQLKIDYSIEEVLESFNMFVKEPKRIDSLILVHQYTCDVWENGSKYLYFYTLHNQEHATILIKNINRIIKTISYIQISSNDYYILFIACYLHDISMVKIPSMDMFLLDKGKADIIGAEFMDKVKKVDDLVLAKILLKDFYKKIDEFYENEIRKNHAQDSANEIRTRKDLNFLDSYLKETIAEISAAHGYRVEDIYNIASDAKSRLVSIKFDKILLRIADLLDMDKYRVSRPILNHNLDQMSEVSAFHWISHLLTRKFELETKYEIKKQHKSVLDPKSIIEKIIIKIYVDISQMSQIDNYKKCSQFGIKDNTLSNNGFDFEIGKKCENKECNFLCKWFVKKNRYLLEECAALKSYLNRIPNNFYESDIEVKICIDNKTELNENEFEIIKDNIK